MATKKITKKAAYAAYEKTESKAEKKKELKAGGESKAEKARETKAGLKILKAKAKGKK